MNSLPIFLPACADYNNNTPDAGDLFVLRDNFFGANPTNFRITVRTYTKSGNTELFAARGEGDELPTEVAPTTASQTEKSANQFFLTGAPNWERLDTLTSDAFEFVAAVCDPTYDLQGDMTSCECPAGEFDTGTSCRALERTDCQTTEYFNEANTPPTCDLRTTANNDCIGDQTVVANICENPVCDSTATLENGVCECTDANPERVDATTCRPRTRTDCEMTEYFNEANTPPTCDLRTPENNDCIGDQTVVANLCENPTCIGEQSLDENNGVCINPTCEATHIFNNAENAKTCDPRTSAACTDSEVFEPASGGGGICISAAEVLATVAFDSPEYTADSCVRAKWQTGFAFSNGKQEVAEVCEIPVMRNDSATASAAATAAGDISPQIANGESANECIMRASAGFSAAANMPDCRDPQLFGNERFPVRPETFNAATDMLILANGAFSFNNEMVMRDSPPQSSQTAARTGGGNGSGGKFIFSGIGLFWAIYSWQKGAGEFNFSPDGSYSLTESGYSANAAGQLNFRDENLHIYWRAGQQNTNGNFGNLHYESGGKYAADFWSATFSETITGKTANYDFALSADFQNGIWKISPTYRINSEWKESETGIQTETNNALNLEGILRYNRWTISPSAGFRWENADDFANSGKFRMNAVYRF